MAEIGKTKDEKHAVLPGAGAGLRRYALSKTPIIANF
jgi:hypothetical protein